MTSINTFSINQVFKVGTLEYKILNIEDDVIYYQKTTHRGSRFKSIQFKSCSSAFFRELIK